MGMAMAKAKKILNNSQGNTNKEKNISNQKISSNIKDINPASAKKNSSMINKNIVALTHEQIAERAKTIWMNKGCPNNQDEQNWYDAESQLKEELGIK